MSTSDAVRPQILVVEDSSVFREMQGLLLRQAGFGVWLFEHPAVALAEAARQRFDLVVIDYELPEMNGEQFMHKLRALQPQIEVVFVSGSLTLELAIKLSRQGVAGIFNKPANPKTLLEKINETLSRSARDTAVRTGSSSPLPGAPRTAAVVPAPEPRPGQLAYEPRYVFGQSGMFRDFTHRLWKVRDFRSVLLLQGEPGSPFELFARELAGISVFREGPVMACSAAEFEPRRLIEVLAPSLLSQDAGTLIVTGVESFTAAQQKTLENLTTGRDVFLPFARRFRLVLAATPRLAERVEEGAFGDTLFYKISALSLSVPSLRDLAEDIVPLSERLLQHHQSTADAGAPATLTAEAAAWLQRQDWPGNYEQLSQTLIFATRHTQGAQLDLPALEAGDRDYQASIRPQPAPVPDAEAAAAPRTATPARPGARAVETPSLFRPASQGYHFGKRLAESIALADACMAG